ncbi:MAG TPA: hypothetical protein VFJ91_12180, partial [Gaiellaceae bacterium]|nr:hypothetical protein [Gaiellaceae bacterium]
MAFDASGDATRRVALASVLIVALLAAAFGVTIWRYQHSRAASTSARQSLSQQLDVQNAATAFWQAREAMNEYLASGEQDLLSEITDGKTAFAASLQAVNADEANEQALIAKASAANDTFVARFDSLAPAAAGTTPAQERQAIESINTLETSVTDPLGKLQQIYATEVADRRAAASTAARQALIAALVGAALALLGGIAFSLYALRLLGRLGERERALRLTVGELHEREEALQQTIETLSDRDQLLERITATASVLGGVANELRAAAQESAAATTEQSSAVAETSATIEQLAATATGIA